MQEKLMYARGNVQKGYAHGVEADIGWFGCMELHGPFTTENEAHNYGVELMRSRVDVTKVKPVKIELVQTGAATERTDLAPWTPEQDNFRNLQAQEGCDRCFCGCKYWENDRCVDCGTHVSLITR